MHAVPPHSDTGNKGSPCTHCCSQGLDKGPPPLLDFKTALKQNRTDFQTTEQNRAHAAFPIPASRGKEKRQSSGDGGARPGSAAPLRAPRAGVSRYRSPRSTHANDEQPVRGHLSTRPHTDCQCPRSHECACAVFTWTVKFFQIANCVTPHTSTCVAESGAIRGRFHRFARAE
jgi:hypothetical protein